MAKQYLHPADDEFEEGMLKVFYQIQDPSGQKLGEVWSLPSAAIDDTNPRLSRWSDNQSISIADPDAAASLCQWLVV